VATLFNVISGFAISPDYEHLLVAPAGVRSGLLSRIEREIHNQAAGKSARIRFKCNALVDEAIIDALYRASQAGIQVELVVRGICALKPGVPGLSENIRVVSQLGRFLEHSRVYEFENGGDPETLIGSADIMHRNLDRRVETLVALTEPAHRIYIREVLDLALSKSVGRWELQSNGEWVRTIRDDFGDVLADYQETMIRSQRAKHSIGNL
jgi:polyphosphate kinase